MRYIGDIFCCVSMMADLIFFIDDNKNLNENVQFHTSLLVIDTRKIPIKALIQLRISLTI